MRLPVAGGLHLTYCTNVHPGESWAEVRTALERHVPAVKARVAPDRPFGVGLRLSAAAAASLEQPAERDVLRRLLARHGLYVFTLNGFPYGSFHATAVKQRVYLPDWLEESRLEYTDRLALLLADLLPPDPGLEGSVSTVPGAFKPRVRGRDDEEAMAERLLRHAALLHRIRERTGRTIALALEPEPFCHMETIAETVRFFEDRLFVRTLPGLSGAQCEAALRRHLGVCFDACHMAVGHEEPRQALAALRGAGIRVAKLQVSAGLEVAFSGAPEERAELRRFADPVYLHQVVERRGATLKRYLDLPEALASAGTETGPRLWRVHFHVPLFQESFGGLRSTRPYVEELLRLVAEDPPTRHLEVETYTWDVLPEEHRRMDVAEAVARELSWVQSRLAL